MNKLSKNQPDKKESGQSLVETAIFMVVLITILGGVLDIGRIYFTYLALQHAAGEGATYGSMFPTRHFSPGCANARFCPSISNDPNNILYRVQHENPSRLVDWAGTTVSIDLKNNSTTAGDPISVTVRFQYDVMLPVVEAIMGDTITLTATAVNTIVGFD